MSNYIPLPYPVISPLAPSLPTAPVMVYAAPPPEPYLPGVEPPITFPDPSALTGTSVSVGSGTFPDPSSTYPEPSPSLAIAGIEAYRANVESPERADFFVIPPMFQGVFAPGSTLLPVLVVVGLIYLAVKS